MNEQLTQGMGQLAMQVAAHYGNRNWVIRWEGGTQWATVEVKAGLGWEGFKIGGELVARHGAELKARVDKMFASMDKRLAANAHD